MMILKKIHKEYIEISKREIRSNILENFTWGLLGSTIVVFIALRIDIAVLLAYVTYYFFVGKIINRPKYTSSLGKFIVFPIPAALGAFTGYQISYLVSNLL